MLISPKQPLSSARPRYASGVDLSHCREVMIREHSVEPGRFDALVLN